ncbi:MAG TPA: hypothetical protein VN963_10080, partial [bacterium]|nr:hypothetical protein [bacterium]
MQPGTWLRRCYGRYGMGRGLILYEDRVSLWNDNLPPHDKIDWNNTMRISGDWNVKTSGDYLFKVPTANVTWFYVDGKKIINVPTGNNMFYGSEKINLNKGIHHVEMITNFSWEHQVPKVLVMPPNSSTEIPFDTYAASSVEGSGIDSGAGK